MSQVHRLPNLSGALFALGIGTLLGGCAITQSIKPVAKSETTEICVIENPKSEMDFGPTYEMLLAERGYQVRRLPPFSPFDQCPVTSTYMGIWRWDVTIYMVYADIKIYQGGQLAGQATYDSQKGGANLSKFIKAEPKIRELVSELLPPVERVKTKKIQTPVASSVPSQAPAVSTALVAPTTDAKPGSSTSATALPMPVPASNSSRPTVGQSSFNVERLAKDNHSCTAPVSALTAKGPGFETYIVSCDNGEAISFRCDLGNCRELR